MGAVGPLRIDSPRGQAQSVERRLFVSGIESYRRPMHSDTQAPPRLSGRWCRGRQADHVAVPGSHFCIRAIDKRLSHHGACGVIGLAGRSLILLPGLPSQTTCLSAHVRPPHAHGRSTQCTPGHGSLNAGDVAVYAPTRGKSVQCVSLSLARKLPGKSMPRCCAIGASN